MKLVPDTTTFWGYGAFTAEEYQPALISPLPISSFINACRFDFPFLQCPPLKLWGLLPRNVNLFIEKIIFFTHFWAGFQWGQLNYLKSKAIFQVPNFAWFLQYIDLQTYSNIKTGWRKDDNYLNSTHDRFYCWLYDCFHLGAQLSHCKSR